MSHGEETEYTFTCPECGESLAVNRAMRVVLVEKGCVVCGGDVTTEAFTGRSTPRSR